MKLRVNSVNEINLKEINVKSHLPESLNKLEEIAQNIWWAWDSNAKSLFRQIDREAWIEASSNRVL
jgi:starch phosphorylase